MRFIVIAKCYLLYYRISFQMKKIIVPFISIAFYLAIYAAIVLLKPSQHDHLRQAHHLTYSLVQKLNHVLHLQKSASEMQLQNNISCKYNKSEILNQVQSTIYQKMGYKNTKKGKAQIVYRVFDGLLTHLELMSHKEANDNQSLLHIYENEQSGNNLMLVYENTAKTIKKILQSNNITLSSSIIENDAFTNQLLTNLSIVLKNTTLDNYDKYLLSLFKVQQVLVVYENVSNMVESISGKDWTVLHNQLYKFVPVIQCEYNKRVNFTNSQLIELISFFDSISQSLQIYYKYKGEEVKLHHMRSWFDHGHMYTFIIGLGVVIVYMFLQINIDKKVKKSFRHTFPGDRRFKIE